MKTSIIITIFLFLNSCVHSQQEQHYSGTYQSVMGVKNSLSCYAYNTGYLTTTTGERLNLSFDSLKEDKVKSGQLSVIGYFKEITHKSGKTDPCPNGTKKFFIVKSYKTQKE